MTRIRCLEAAHQTRDRQETYRNHSSRPSRATVRTSNFLRHKNALSITARTVSKVILPKVVYTKSRRPHPGFCVHTTPRYRWGATGGTGKRHDKGSRHRARRWGQARPRTPDSTRWTILLKDLTNERKVFLYRRETLHTGWECKEAPRFETASNNLPPVETKRSEGTSLQPPVRRTGKEDACHLYEQDFALV